ncbi:DNA polymerase III subunit delta [Ovoidimarina sediminis]|uniref:DNA polymerase III subunit delta n=1 Tax=Ovoidimarina sediminis TaxID=3079856 RepID=UPI00291515EC|nr:DNA polymerase III subunit delta [Rhodophyticola sp. MJ-SS7]MDU8943781.1 DNA polymerase III subunit delta [Rhodophyticola sp. MJ-SS7]
MKLSGRDAAAYFRKPDPDKAGLLIFGQDGMRVALRRQEVIRALVGSNGEEEMRLTRLSAADVRKDPATVHDGLKAQGFFPGPRVVFVDEAGDGLTPALETALGDWQPGDAQLVVTAGSLNARSALRKLFEAGRATVAIGIYDDPPSQEEIEAMLADAGLKEIPREAAVDLDTLARALDPGDFRQTIERIALYKLNDPAPLTPDEIADLAPATIEAAVDDILHVVAESRHGEIGPLMARLRAQGVSAVALSIAATRHFRALHAAASDPGGPAAGLARLRPPVFGPRRDRMGRQAQTWGARKLEEALRVLIDTDLTLRSRNRAPDMGVMERTLIRLAMMGAR